MSTPGVPPAQFRELLGRFATGVTVLTTRGPDGHPVGMTASSLASVSLEPPLISVCVDRRHDMHAALSAAPRFVVNILAADQETLSRRFAEDGADRFAGVAYRETTEGLPVLDGALAHLECEPHAVFPGGDHSIFVGRVTGGSVSERRPLLYYRGGYAGQSGL